MIVTRSDIESFKRFVPKLALAGAAVLILSAFAPSSDAAVFTAREGDAPLEFTLPAHETTMVAIPADPIASAVYDRHLIDVQTDAASGMLYVLPKMEGSAMVYGFVEAAAEVGSMSPGSIDHLDLDKRDLDFGGSYACNKRCQGAYPYDEGTRKTLISQKCRKSQNF